VLVRVREREAERQGDGGEANGGGVTPGFSGSQKYELFKIFPIIV
jgi:hypothetical protein